MCKKNFKKQKGVVIRISNFSSFNHHAGDIYEKTTIETNFLKYKNSDNVYDVYSKFTQKVMEVIEKVAPTKTKRIKRNVGELFDTAISEELIIQDKLFKKCKNLQRHLQVSTVKYAKVHCKKVQVNL